MSKIIGIDHSSLGSSHEASNHKPSFERQALEHQKQSLTNNNILGGKNE